VCATSKGVSLPFLLRSYPPTRETTDLYHSVKIWEAGRATSAASSFFEPIAVGPLGQEFLDGGTGANNPVRQLWNEAADTFCHGSSTRLLQNIRTLVSIGTGIPDLNAFGDDPLTIGKTLLDMSTETQTTANEFHRNNSDLDDDGRYYRFNVGRGLAGIGLEEANEAGRIKELTDAYLVEQSTYSSIRKCARTLGDSIVSAAPETLQSTST
jgi:predicted acylesterase/phospholipase RssA